MKNDRPTIQSSYEMYLFTSSEVEMASLAYTAACCQFSFVKLDLSTTAVQNFNEEVIMAEHGSNKAIISGAKEMTTFSIDIPNKNQSLQ